MSAHDHFRAGSLSAAIEAQIESVKAHPSDPDERFFLVGLFSFAGQPDRALTHLDVLCDLDPEYGRLAALYRSLLEADEERRRIHAAEHRPALPTTGSREAEVRLDLLAALASGDAAARPSLAEQLSGFAAPAGRINGQPFSSFANTDDVLGPTIEVFAGGRCLWMPLASIRTLETREPKTLLDLLWLEAELEDAEGQQSIVHLPVRYAGSDVHENELVRLGRITEWQDVDELVARGFGQNTFVCRMEGSEELEEFSLLDIRKLEVEATS